MEHKLDNIDRKIIEMLQKNAYLITSNSSLFIGIGHRQNQRLLPRCLRQDRTP